MGFLALFNIFFAFYLISTGRGQLQPSDRPCSTPGNYAIYDGTCEHYYTCIFDGIEYESYDLKCPDSLVFFPLAGYCVSSSTYTCEQTTSTSVSTTVSTTVARTSTTLDPPLCNATGRFPIKDADCKGYYFCLVIGGITVAFDTLRCPTVLVFNPTLQLCVLPNQYNCTRT